MNDENRQPREYDLVLGGNNPPPTDGLVLGGIEGVKQRLASDDIEVRIAALSNALKYGDEGLDLVIDVLHNESEQMQNAAYSILRSRPNSKTKIILEEYDNARCLRFDGLYFYLFCNRNINHYFNHNINYYYDYLKFCEDGIVISINFKEIKETSDERINEINKFSNDSIKRRDKGKYIVEQNNISFSITNPYTILDYEGKLYRKKMILNIYGRNSDYQQLNKTYNFYPFNI